MADVSYLSATAKVAEAMRRSLKYVGPEAKAELEQLLTPANLSIMAGTVAVWAGSHFFGVGEFVDLILLVVGVFAIGLGVIEGAKELYWFATGAVDARDDADLESAGRHFAKAVDVLGITVVTAVLSKGAAKKVYARGLPKRQPFRVPTASPPAVRRISRVNVLGSATRSVSGTTDFWGNIKLLRVDPSVPNRLAIQRVSLYHEWVHSVLTPRFGPLRNLRASLAWSARKKSFLLAYVEEHLAESFAQLKVNGMAGAIESLNFPVKNGYMTVSQLRAEGLVVGTVVVQGIAWHVGFHLGSPPPDPADE